MIKIFEEGSWNQRKLECAINKCGVEKVFEELCKYICDDDLTNFLSYFCDDKDCWPEDENCLNFIGKKTILVTNQN